MTTRYRARVVIEGDTKEVRKALRQLEQQAGETGVKLKQNFGRATRGTEAEASSWASRMKKLLSPQNLLGAIGIGAGIAGVGSILTKMFGEARDSAADFQEKMAEVSTIVDTTKTDMKALTKEVSATAKEFGKPHVEQAAGLYQILSAGITDTTKAMDVLRVATKAGIAGVTDTATAVDGITSILNAFGLEAEDAEHVADVMFETVKRGKLVFRDLSQFLGQAAPTFAAIGVPFETLLAAVATLTASGIKPAQAFEGLRSLAANIIRPSEQAKKTAAALGKEFSTSAVRAKGLAGFLREISEAAKGNEEVLGTLYGDITGLNVALVLGGQQANRFEGDLRGMEEGAGAMGEAFEKMSEIYKQNRREYEASMEGFKIAFGNQFLPTMTAVLQALTNWSEAVQGNIEIRERWIDGWRKEGQALDSWFTGWFDEWARKLEGTGTRLEGPGRKMAGGWGRGFRQWFTEQGPSIAGEVDTVATLVEQRAQGHQDRMGAIGRLLALPFVDGFLDQLRGLRSPAEILLSNLASGLQGIVSGIVDGLKQRIEGAKKSALSGQSSGGRTGSSSSGGAASHSPSPTPEQILESATGGQSGQSDKPPPISTPPGEILRRAAEKARAEAVQQKSRGGSGGAPPGIGPSPVDLPPAPTVPRGGGSGAWIRLMARGGRVTRRGWAVTGEEGPELTFFDQPAAEVIPNSLTQMAFKRGLGTAPMTNVFQITVNGAGSPAEARVLGEQVGEGILSRLERLVNL